MDNTTTYLVKHQRSVLHCCRRNFTKYSYSDSQKNYNSHVDLVNCTFGLRRLPRHGFREGHIWLRVHVLDWSLPKFIHSSLGFNIFFKPIPTFFTTAPPRLWFYQCMVKHKISRLYICTLLIIKVCILTIHMYDKTICSQLKKVD